MLERAIGAARSADNLRAELVTLRTQLAQSQTVASVQGEVTTERTGWIADVLGWLEGVRAILLSLVMDIVALMMPWIALRLEQARNRQMGMAEGIERHPWMIEDLRGADVVDSEGRKKQPEPMDPPRTVVTDAETGEELTHIKPKPYWRKVRRGKKTPMDVPAENRGPPEDERGVVSDGGRRIAMSVAGPVELPPAVEASDQEAAQSNDAGAEQQSAAEAEIVVTHPEPPIELSDAEIAALADDLAAEEQQQQPDEQTAQPEPEARVEQGDEDADHREPERNPGRMIAAE